MSVIFKFYTLTHTHTHIHTHTHTYTHPHTHPHTHTHTHSSYIYSTIPEIDLTDEDSVLVAMVTRELQGYIGCLEKLKYVA